MIRITRSCLNRPSNSDYGWKGYAYKKLNDPNKWKSKYARRKGWQFEEALQYDQSTDEWNQFSNPSTKFPFKLGFDNLNGPIRHRDFRSGYKDRPKVKIPAYFDRPHSTAYESGFHDEKALRVYREVYAKCGPESEDYSFLFDLGDIVEIVSGRAKGERGPVCYIDSMHNYILVSGCNYDYSLKSTGIFKGRQQRQPAEVPVLPKHIRLVSPKTGDIIENTDIEMSMTYNDDYVYRRNVKTGEILPKMSDSSDTHDNDYVKADAALHCRIKDYPNGDNDTTVTDYLSDFRSHTTTKTNKKFDQALRKQGLKYQDAVQENAELRKQGRPEFKNYTKEPDQKNTFELKSPTEMTYQEELAMVLDIDLGKGKPTYFY